MKIITRKSQKEIAKRLVKCRNLYESNQKDKKTTDFVEAILEIACFTGGMDVIKEMKKYSDKVSDNESAK